MVKVMKIMATSFKRSHVHIATLCAHSPAAGHRRPMPLLETPGHSRASLGGVSLFQGHCSLLLGPGAQGSVCALQDSVSQPSVSSGGSMVGSLKKQESSRKTSISALLTMPKPLTVWITTNCGKF